MVNWPELPYEAWKDTYATLHMWMQVVGKVALATAPPLNHGWGVTFHLTPRGMTTRLLPFAERTFAIEFDFVEQRLVIRTVDGQQRALALQPRAVADFHRETMAALRSLALPITIRTMPSEVENPIPLDEDTTHRAYDPEFANRFWRILVSAERVFTDCRSRFIGKVSPVHFFWGGFDLAVTRFSGRPAPPREGPAWLRDAYSHECISHGFWPGGPRLPEAVFYAYSIPEPAGFQDVQVEPKDAYYHRGFSEFVLPYEAVRSAADPDATLASFVDSTYDRAATLAKWDRAALER